MSPRGDDNNDNVVDNNNNDHNKVDPIAGTEHSTGHNNDQKSASSSQEPVNPLFQWGVGLRQDWRLRAPLYWDDWKVSNPVIVFNATIYAFVIQLIPALIFAELMDRETQGNLATAETLLSSAIIGVIYAVCAGQPLVIMGITGPVAILLGTSFSLTETFDADYFSFFFWTCLWAGLMHMGSALFGLVHLVWKVTPFTSQIFELFIAVTFIYASVRDLVEPIHFLQETDDPDRAAQYASLVVGLITFYVAWTLHFAETWTTFSRKIRVFVASYNTLLAIVVGTAFSYLPGVDQPQNGVGGLDRVNIRVWPWNWQPTLVERKWIVNPLEGIDAAGIFAAMIPGFMFFLLFIIDHNVSSILTQAPKFNLRKPPAYHWDFFVLGVTFLPCALLGLPPGNGLIPQAPLHCRALCTRNYETMPDGTKREIVVDCQEQRWSGLGQSLLMLVALASFRVLALIPRGSLFGLFLYLGMGALNGNEIWERITWCARVPKHRPPIPVVLEVKSWRTVQLWTLIQLSCALAIFGVAQFASVGFIYPALLTALVPLRAFVLERFFDADDLQHLDPVESSPEEFQQEQRQVQLPVVPADEDEPPVEIPPSRASFRAGGFVKDQQQTTAEEAAPTTPV